MSTVENKNVFSERLKESLLMAGSLRLSDNLEPLHLDKLRNSLPKHVFQDHPVKNGLLLRLFWYQETTFCGLSMTLHLCNYCKYNCATNHTLFTDIAASYLTPCCPLNS